MAKDPRRYIPQSYNGLDLGLLVTFISVLALENPHMVDFLCCGVAMGEPGWKAEWYIKPEAQSLLRGYEAELIAALTPKEVPYAEPF